MWGTIRHERHEPFRPSSRYKSIQLLISMLARVWCLFEPSCFHVYKKWSRNPSRSLKQCNSNHWQYRDVCSLYKSEWDKNLFLHLFSFPGNPIVENLSTHRPLLAISSHVKDCQEIGMNRKKVVPQPFHYEPWSLPQQKQRLQSSPFPCSLEHSLEPKNTKMSLDISDFIHWISTLFIIFN